MVSSVFLSRWCAPRARSKIFRKMILRFFLENSLILFISQCAEQILDKMENIFVGSLQGERVCTGIQNICFI